MTGYGIGREAAEWPKWAHSCRNGEWQVGWRVRKVRCRREWRI